MFKVKFSSGREEAFETLENANLKGAYLKGANLAGANLAGANLDGCAMNENIDPEEEPDVEVDDYDLFLYA